MFFIFLLLGLIFVYLLSRAGKINDYAQWLTLGLFVSSELDKQTLLLYTQIDANFDKIKNSIRLLEKDGIKRITFRGNDDVPEFYIIITKSVSVYGLNNASPIIHKKNIFNKYSYETYCTINNVCDMIELYFNEKNKF